MNNMSFLVVSVVFVLACICTTAFAQDTRSLTISGYELTAEEAKSLEKQLKLNPNDTALRTKLLGYYFINQYRNLSAPEARQKHLLWLIVNSPQSEVLGIPEGTLDAIREKDAYAQAKKAWLNNIPKNPEDLILLKHSANFFDTHDSELAIELLKKGRALDMDNPLWPTELGYIYLRDIKSSSNKVLEAEKALEQFEIAYELSTDTEQNLLLINLAKIALEANNTQKAKKYARQILNQNHRDCNYGDNIHHGNLILGRIALGSNDIEEAKKRLIKAGKTPGSPALNSFGPNMALALELLKKGEKEVVLKYFDLCLTFWKHRKDRIQKWKNDIENDELPNFSANLDY